MAELIKIQPQVPQTAPGQVRVPTLGGEYLGRGLEQFGEVFGRIQEAADMSESRALVATGQQVLAGTHKESNLTYDNPDVFQTEAVNNLKTARDSIVNQASNQRVKSHVSRDLNDEFIKYQYQIKFDAQGKRLEIAKQNSEIFLEQKQRELMAEPDLTKRVGIETEIVNHMQDMTRVGAYKKDDAVKKMYKIWEADAYVRAFNDIQTSDDPLGTVNNLMQRYPNLDPNKMIAASRQADVADRRIKAEAEKKANEDRQDAVVGAMAIALDPKQGLSMEQLNAIAGKYRLKPDEYKSVIAAMESGGVTDPSVYNSYTVAIQSGKILDYNQVAQDPRLDRGAKSRLLAEITSRKDHYVSEGRAIRSEQRALESHAQSLHFSRSPEYQSAIKRFDEAIRKSGPLDFNEGEQRQREWGYEQLYRRAQKGERPDAILEDIVPRAKAMKDDMGPQLPPAQPKFNSENELLDAFRQGKISKWEAEQESLIFEQYKGYQEYQSTRPPPKGKTPPKAAAPKKTGEK